jgi:flagellar biosynthesis protein FlhF
LNIRKFTGATSRDALRLVRAALGSDAVVLSTRTMDGGSVEIVALADSDLASIAPAAGDGAAPATRPPALFANPYANGMPDVFSAVFGASPEVGAQPAADPAKRANAPAAPQAADAATPGFAERAEPQLRTHRTDDALARTAPSVGAAAAAATAAADVPRTMAESNPWLIDHALRIAAPNPQLAHVAKPHAMTPAVATAKGLGAPGKVLTAEELAAAEPPDWAREAAQAAARRAASHAVPAYGPTGGYAATDAAPARARARSPGAARRVASELPGLPAHVTAAVAEELKARVEQVVSETVMNELSSIRGMMEEQFAGLVWSDRQRRSPAHGGLTKHLFAAGFSAQLVRMMIDNMPEVENFDAGMEWVRSVLDTNLPVMGNEEALMERGGVFALMGPTGVGKTTTTAKLAARCVMRFGASKVALLTTDSYRIGGHEQLRIFGKILGVSVHAVKDAADLQLALSELRNKHIVLIDTIGMSQRDRTVSDQIAMLCGAGQPVQRLLLLNATSHGDTLNEVVQAYQSAPDQPALAGCILTKLDEATNLGGVLDTVIRYKLPVHYVSTGQKVPENLYVATKKFLIKSTFCIPRDGSPFVPHDDDIPALLSALSTRTTADLHEVRFG